MYSSTPSGKGLDSGRAGGVCTVGAVGANTGAAPDAIDLEPPTDTGTPTVGAAADAADGERGEADAPGMAPDMATGGTEGSDALPPTLATGLVGCAAIGLEGLGTDLGGNSGWPDDGCTTSVSVGTNRGGTLGGAVDIA
jgi:hypothetical protein